MAFGGKSKCDGCVAKIADVGLKQVGNEIFSKPCRRVRDQTELRDSAVTNLSITAPWWWPLKNKTTLVNAGQRKSTLVNADQS